MSHLQYLREGHADINMRDKMEELQNRMVTWAIGQIGKRLKANCQAINEVFPNIFHYLFQYTNI